ncbi:hypothetical protein GCM10010492_26170 [Saccharothrix mutabilis subsp. mutabilis]|uniref:Aromatic amino acid beta-eliminating lyase/threonine aldolase domain-containing protein n=1 Tax=Saccharothrix mutabilis subsp. mutabilis TaxID=66855 RepID=A0ABN0TP75_9PSEU
MTQLAPLDFRSDTVTRPDEAMRLAMSTAEVADDVLEHDPTMLALEERVADLLGVEAALWVPSGSMGNLIALTVHLRPGDRFLAARGAHVLDNELGTAAWIAGGMPHPLEWDAPGRFTADAVRARPAPTARTTRCARPCCAWRTPTTRPAAPSPRPTSTPCWCRRPARRA